MPGQEATDAVVMLRGEKVGLASPTRELIPRWFRWDNDISLSLLAGDAARPRPPEAAEAEYGSYFKGEQHDWVLFTVLELPDERPIGITELTGIDPFNGTAEYGIRIGESDCWARATAPKPRA